MRTRTFPISYFLVARIRDPLFPRLTNRQFPKLGNVWGARATSRKNMLAQNKITIPRERSLVDLVFKTFSNWGKSENPPSAAAAKPIVVMQSIYSFALASGFLCLNSCFGSTTFTDSRVFIFRYSSTFSPSSSTLYTLS